MDKNTEKRLLLNSRIQTGALLCILLLIFGGIVFVSAQMSSLSSGIALMDADLKELDMEEIDGTIQALHDAAEKLAAVDMEQFNETAEALKDAAEQLAGVDTESLNETVTALKGAAENLSEVDVETLNELIKALETSAETLKSAVAAIKGVFQR